MTIEQVKNVTTSESPVTYQVTLRITCLDMDYPRSNFAEELTSSVLEAINGISAYKYYKGNR